MLIPLHDHNPGDKLPLVTYTIIGLNVLIWFAVQGMGINPMFVESICRFGLVPGIFLGNLADGTLILSSPIWACRFDGSTDYYTVVSSMFMHGGWLHLILNIWFLFIFGENVENVMGRVRFIIFYFACGFIAAFTHIASDPNSSVPMVGASGALGGVMGAYIILYPRARVKMLLFLLIFVTIFEVPAVLILGLWFVVNLLAFLSQLDSTTSGGMAVWGHLGGFLSGMGLILLMRPKQQVLPLQR